MSSQALSQLWYSDTGYKNMLIEWQNSKQRLLFQMEEREVEAYDGFKIGLGHQRTKLCEVLYGMVDAEKCTIIPRAELNGKERLF